MNRRIRNMLITLGVALGFVVATAAPASAGINLANHSEPLTLR
jgi:hypothetical protein